MNSTLVDLHAAASLKTEEFLASEVHAPSSTGLNGHILETDISLTAGGHMGKADSSSTQSVS